MDPLTRILHRRRRMSFLEAVGWVVVISLFPAVAYLIANAIP
jgi:hypothetical protein